MRFPIRSDRDVLVARREARALADRRGFSSTEATFVATAISELSRNILCYAGQGEVLARVIHDRGRRGMLVEASDDGPGIADVEAALRDGYSTSRSLGLGLPGVRRLMDEFEIRSARGTGTTVSAIKWGFATEGEPAEPERAADSATDGRGTVLPRPPIERSGVPRRRSGSGALKKGPRSRRSSPRKARRV